MLFQDLPKTFFIQLLQKYKNIEANAHEFRNCSCLSDTAAVVPYSGLIIINTVSACTVPDTVAVE
jgi:hypothetical protein